MVQFEQCLHRLSFFSTFKTHHYYIVKRQVHIKFLVWLGVKVQQKFQVIMVFQLH